ncbi:PPE family protein [Mycobacterium sp. MUNTM1]
MDFGALPPEINSGRIYSGPGPATLLAAAGGWESLAAELTDAASGYQTVTASLTDESWLGPASMTMAAAVLPYIAWMTATAGQCGQAATQATAAATAFETAYAMTVPPPLIGANRARLLALIQTNIFGQNTPAIMVTEAEYSEMWAQDATAMYSYAATSASASTLSPMPSPPQTTTSAGLGGHIGAVSHAAAHAGSNTPTQWLSSVPQTLQGLSTPGSSPSSGLSQAAMGAGASLGSSGASAPLSSLSGLTGASGKGATKSASTGAGAAAGLASALAAAPAADGATAGLASEAAGYGADGAGLIADGGGIGIDLYGLDLDYQGLALDEAGAGSILGAEGSAGMASMGGAGAATGSGNLAPLAALGQGASASVGQASSLSTLSVPPSWAATVSSVTPLHALNGGALPGGWAAAPTAAPGTAVSKVPLGGMVGRESEGAVQRVGLRVSLIPHSPVAG